jgi:hypothetical protein
VKDVVEAMDKNVHAGLQQIAKGLSEYFASHPVEPEQPSTN